MLQQKWTLTDDNGNTYLGERSKGTWGRSLGHKWAVVKLARDKKAAQERGPLKIEKVRSTPMKTPQKSVNEMLAEMRMKDAPGDVGMGKCADGTGDGLNNSKHG